MKLLPLGFLWHKEKCKGNGNHQSSTVQYTLPRRIYAEIGDLSSQKGEFCQHGRSSKIKFRCYFIARHRPDPRTQLAVECSYCRVPSLSLSVRLHICHTSHKMNQLYLATLSSQCVEHSANYQSTHTGESLMNRSCNKSLFLSHLSLSRENSLEHSLALSSSLYQ